MLCIDSGEAGGAWTLKSLRALVPFVFSECLKPTEIATVGDQMLCEHLFGFHARISRFGFESLLSDVLIDEEKKTVCLTAKHDVKRSDGIVYSARDVCDSLACVLGGSNHFSMSSIVKGVELRDNSVTLIFSEIPRNIRYLLTLPDFCLEDGSAPPLSSSALRPTTGPYSLNHLESRSATLLLNPHYPAGLRANNVPVVRLDSYPAGGTAGLISSLSDGMAGSSAPDFAYFYGFAMRRRDFDLLEQADYTTEIFSREWIVLLSMSDRVPLPVRRVIANVIDAMRARIANEVPFARLSYSIAPQDQPHGTTEEEYGRLRLRFDEAECAALQDVEPLTVEYLDEWESVPIFQMVREELALKCAFLRFCPYSRSRMNERFRMAEILLTPFGQSPRDPLPNLTYFARCRPGFGSVLRPDELAELAGAPNSEEFVRGMKVLNERIHASRLIVPIAHFPGVVAARRQYSRDDSLAFDWGIQTWTYRLR